MKKPILLFIVFSIIGFVGAFTLLKSLTIENPGLEDTQTMEITVTEITEGSSNDIVFKDAGTDSYYINRGLERGLTIEGLKEKVLNKRVTLRLAKLWIGTSEHISYLAVGDEVIFTEID